MSEYTYKPIKTLPALKAKTKSTGISREILNKFLEDSATMVEITVPKDKIRGYKIGLGRLIAKEKRPIEIRESEKGTSIVLIKKD